MQGFIDWLKGKKTYLVAVIGMACYGALGMEWISQGTFDSIAVICALLGIGFLRAGISKMVK